MLILLTCILGILFLSALLGLVRDANAAKGLGADAIGDHPVHSQDTPQVMTRHYIRVIALGAALLASTMFTLGFTFSELLGHSV